MGTYYLAHETLSGHKTLILPTNQAKQLPYSPSVPILYQFFIMVWCIHVTKYFW